MIIERRHIEFPDWETRFTGHGPVRIVPVEQVKAEPTIAGFGAVVAAFRARFAGALAFGHAAQNSSAQLSIRATVSYVVTRWPSGHIRRRLMDGPLLRESYTEVF